MEQAFIIDPQATKQRKAWKAVSIAGLIPGIVYIALLILALGFRIEAPARWIFNLFWEGPFTLGLVWILTIGGPLISVIANLVLQLPPPPKRKRTDNKGMVIWIVLLLCIFTTFPFPWLILLFTD